jgi:hypothetical protein
MKKFTAESYRHLLIVLFFLFETLFLASVVALFLFDRRWNLQISAAAGIGFWFSFIGQLVVCFLLRRSVRRLAIIGWITLFVGFWGLAFFPVL